jgi:hypothetical protein
LGDDWDLELSNAQHSSKVTVVLVSQNTHAAYYEREEIAAAVALARQNAKNHRVVPLRIQHDATPVSLPYGLHLKHGLTVSGLSDLPEAAEKLIQLLSSLEVNDDQDQIPVSRPPLPERTNPVSLQELAAVFSALPNCSFRIMCLRPT